jgi:hypothetical protein
MALFLMLLEARLLQMLFPLAAAAVVAGLVAGEWALLWFRCRSAGIRSVDLQRVSTLLSLLPLLGRPWLLSLC